MEAEDLKTTNGTTTILEEEEETPNHNHDEAGNDEMLNSTTKEISDLKIANGSGPAGENTTGPSSSEQGELHANHASPEPSDTATRRYSLDLLDSKAGRFSPDQTDSKVSRYSFEAGDSRSIRFSPDPIDSRASRFTLDTRINRISPDMNKARGSRFAPEQAETVNANRPEAVAEVKKTSRYTVESGDFKAQSAYSAEPPSPQTAPRPGNETEDGSRNNRRNFELGDVIADDVLCDSCIEGKKKAVRSCLVCQTSFCDVHLKPHLEGAAFRDHKLLDPIKDFEARKCQLHSKTMELFCQADQVCICYLCMFQEHKNHNTVTVEAEKYVKEAELSEIQEQLHLQILDVGDEEEKWQKEKDRIKNYTTNQKSAVDNSFKDLMRELQRQRDEVMVGLDQKEREAMENVEHIVNELEGKREQLQMRQHDGAKLLLTTDAVLFLQEFQVVIRNAPPIPPLPTYSVILEGEKLTQSMAGLRDDLIGVCRKHVDKVLKTDLSRNLIEKNNPDNRYMMKDYSSGWNQSDSYNRFTSLLSAPGRTLTDSSPQSLNSIYGTKSRTFPDSPSAQALSGLYGTQGPYNNLRQWESSPIQSLEDNSASSSLSYPYQNMGQVTTEVSKQTESSLYSTYPMITRHQTTKPQTQTWKSSKQSLLSHQRPFYVNKGKAANSTDPQ
ncbi:tripartite motif-containing protein 29 isoform X2 [Pleurodeles waltl]|uniref:tripartite motif-containing protein 29 isoform X2 n=1 Tax=Pleurodeles waltl TaxID=8319 RepID=UPI0037093E40